MLLYLLLCFVLISRNNNVIAWTGFQSLEGGINSIAASSWGPGRYDVFGVADDGTIWHRVFNDKWSNWYSIGGSANSKPSAFSLTYNWVDVMYTGSDKRMYRKTWNGNKWLDWQASPNGGAFLSGPSITSGDDDQLHVFGIGLDSALYHCVIIVSKNQWSPWENLGGSVVGDPAAVSWGPGRYDAFVIGPDQKVWQKTYDGGWQNWVNPFDGKFKPGVGGTSKAPGTINIVLRGLDDAVYHRQYYRGWGNLENIGGQILSSPAAASSDSTRVDTFVVGLNKAAFQNTWELRWTINDGSGSQPEKKPLSNYGCYKGYCWAKCSTTMIDVISNHEWCYTTKTYSQSFSYVKCTDYKDCDWSWKCAGSCTV